MQKITAIKGMNDILPDKSENWLCLESKLQDWLDSYGYTNIRTPIVENTNLFVRSIGEVTDIVEKEMYTFTDNLNGDSLTLRPEGTAGTLRAVLEHNLLYNTTQKLWYIGAMFRHERPQKGRYRQFHQLGVEAFGFAGPEIDAEIILMQHELWHKLGINNLKLHINCLGDAHERALHKTALINYFELHKDILDVDANNRLYSNTLRILDTKNPDLQDLVNHAPKLIDYLGDESLNHYTNWKRLLDELNISYIENPRLVRGLDYYNLSVFEWISSDLGAQATVCAGGRYDPLIKQLGGGDNYAIGFAIGMERLLLILEALNKLPQKDKNKYEIFIATTNARDMMAMSYAFKVAKELRANGYNVVQNLSNNNLKSQFKKANNFGVKYTITIGENEVSSGQVMVKCMANRHECMLHFDKLIDGIIQLDNTLEKEH